MEPESGMMPMDVQEIGYGMDQKMESTTMGMEAALRPPSFETIRKNFPATTGETAVYEQLKTFLNLSPSINRPQNNGGDTAENPFYEVSFTDDPMIVPPVYGAWHGLAEDLKTGTNWPRGCSSSILIFATGQRQGWEQKSFKRDRKYL